MYLHTHQDKECSHCGAINHTEIVTRGNDIWMVHQLRTFIRCTRCGHERELYTIASSSTGGPVIYEMNPTDNKQVF